MDILISVFPALQSLPSLSINQFLLVLFIAYLFTKVLVSKNPKGPLPPGPRGLDSPYSGKYLSDPPVPMAKVHRVAEGIW